MNFIKQLVFESNWQVYVSNGKSIQWRYATEKYIIFYCIDCLLRCGVLV